MSYTAGGTAVGNLNYAALGGTAYFPAGSSLATITVTPWDDGNYDEWSPTVVITITAPPGYGLGSSTASIDIDQSSLDPSDPSDNWDYASTGQTPVQTQDGPFTINDSTGNLQYDPAEEVPASGNSPGTVYQSASVTRPIVPVSFALPAGSAPPTSITASLAIYKPDGSVIQGPTTSFNSSAAAAGGNRYSISVQDDVSATLPTGRYRYHVFLDATMADGTSLTRSYYGYRGLVNHVFGPFGNGWWVQDLDQVVPDSAGDGGVTWFRGDGSSAFFQPNGQGGYVTPVGSYYTMVPDNSGGYDLIGRDGDLIQFNAAGKIIDRADVHGVVTRTYGYITASGPQNGFLQTISDDAHETATFVYNANNLLDHVQGFTGQAVDYGYTANGPGGAYVSSVSRQGPGQSATMSQTNFTYALGLLSSVLDPKQFSTTVNYIGSRASSLAHNTGGGGTRTFQPKSVTNIGGGTLTLGNSPPITPPPGYTYSVVGDALGHFTFYATDPFGYLVVEVDPLYRLSVYTRNTMGQPTSYAPPSQTASGATGPGYAFQYDNSGNLLKLTRPDGDYETWTYEALGNGTTSDRVATATDVMGRVSSYTYDPSSHVLLAATDPLGRTVTYTYNDPYDRELVTRVTMPPTASGIYGAVSDPMTTYAYDYNGRLTSVQQPGGQTYSYAYQPVGAAGTVTDDPVTVTDPRGQDRKSKFLA